MDVQPHTEQEAQKEVQEQVTGTAPAVDLPREEYDETIYTSYEGVPKNHVISESEKDKKTTITTSKVVLEMDGAMLRIKLNDTAKKAMVRYSEAKRNTSGVFFDRFMALGIDYDIELLDIHGNPLRELSRRITAIKFEFTGRKSTVNTTITFEE
jgi:hypothetical protein